MQALWQSLSLLQMSLSPSLVALLLVLRWDSKARSFRLAPDTRA
jgi:hypothetical protein